LRLTTGLFPEAAIGFTSNNVPRLKGSCDVEIVLNGTSIFDALGEVELTTGFPLAPSEFLLNQQGTILNATFANDLLMDGSIGRGYRFGADDRSSFASCGCFVP
jgi:hypothetical protein